MIRFLILIAVPLLAVLAACGSPQSSDGSVNVAQSEEVRIEWSCEAANRAANSASRELLPNIVEVRIEDDSMWQASDFPVVLHRAAHDYWPAAVIGGESDLSLQWHSHGLRVVARINWLSTDREEGSIEVTVPGTSAMLNDESPIRTTGICRRFRHQQEHQASL
jgi:hypothetical protein